MLKFGVISEWKPGFAKVYFQDDDIVTDWWPIIQRFSMQDKESWPLNTNEHVACMTDELLEEGVIIGAIHSEAEPADTGGGAGKFRKVFSDGTVIEYNKTTHILTATVQGKVNITATSDINATSQTKITAKATAEAIIEAPLIQLKGNVTVVGVITAGGISAAPMPGVSGADGKITVDADIETTGDVKAGTISLNSHRHGGVQTGGGMTGTPTP